MHYHSYQGKIPSEIGLLSNLKTLRLSYNSFIGTFPLELEQLKTLELVQLHGNRLSGSISLWLSNSDESSLVSDCGLPSIFEDPLTCEACSMCCKFGETAFTHNVPHNGQAHLNSGPFSCLGNSQDECFFKGEIPIVEAGFDNYIQLSWVFLLSIAGGCVLTHVVLFIYKQFKNNHDSNFNESQEYETIVEEENRYAQEAIGQDSVYRYFLGNTLSGLGISLASVAIQFWMSYEFVMGSEYDFEKSTSDLTYTWMCPRDDIVCRNTNGMVEMFSLMCGRTSACNVF